VRLAYIVSAYKLPDQLVRLVRKLDAPSAQFLIHVDANTDDPTFQRMVAPLSTLPNVRFLERHSCPYGGFGHVRATLKGIAELFQRRAEFDYAILLTGQDYPIKSNGAIAEFFRAHGGSSFMSYFPLPTTEWDRGGMDRIEAWHIRTLSRRVRFPRTPSTRFRRRFPAALRPFGGSSYWCLSRRCIEYVRAFVDRERSYVRFFKFVDVPDELFFQTIIMNSPLAEEVVNDDLRYMEWRNPAVAGGPTVLGKDDFDKLRRSPKLFARKFDLTYDDEILDLLDAATADA
jgi:Core-2/I-Branching enzyme